MSEEEKFIEVNKTIYYYKQYIREVLWLKYDIKRRILDILDKDFVKINEFEETFDHLKISLYNEKLDLKIEIECLKKSPKTYI